MRIGRFDWSSDTVGFYTESTEFGKSAALLYTNMPTNPIWLAGVSSSTVTPNPTWKFALYRLNESDGTII